MAAEDTQQISNSEEWAKNPKKVRDFLFHVFLNQRKRVHLKTARLWLTLITIFLTDNSDPTTRQQIAETRGLSEGAIKQHLRRIRRAADAFFAGGGMYTPREKSERKPRQYDPRTLELDDALLSGRAQWKTPTYRMRADGRKHFLLDASLAYDPERFRGFAAHVPTCLDVERALDGDREARVFLDAFAPERNAPCRKRSRKPSRYRAVRPLLSVGRVAKGGAL